MATATKAKASANGTHKATTSAAGEQQATGFVIPRLKMDTIEVPIVGTTSLILHRWSEKAKKQMLDKQTKRATGPREAKNPEQEYEEATYRDATHGWFGVPSVAFKAAAVGACRFVDDIPMTMAKRLLYVIADGRDKDGTDLTQLVGERTMRQDMVRLDSGSADIRFRPEFLKWSCVLRIRFISSVVSAEMLVNLLEIAGATEGACEWRPSSPDSSTGTHGCWQIVRG
jgi:hypothetical protein